MEPFVAIALVWAASLIYLALFLPDEFWLTGEDEFWLNGLHPVPKTPSLV